MLAILHLINKCIDKVLDCCDNGIIIWYFLYLCTKICEGLLIDECLCGFEGLWIRGWVLLGGSFRFFGLVRMLMKDHCFRVSSCILLYSYVQCNVSSKCIHTHSPYPNIKNMIKSVPRKIMTFQRCIIWRRCASSDIPSLKLWLVPRIKLIPPRIWYHCFIELITLT